MIAVTAATFCVPTSRAGILAIYDFSNYTANSDSGAAATTTGSGLTASNYAPNGPAFLAAGGGSGGPGNYFFTGSGNATPSVGTQSSFVPASETASVTANTYFSLTLTPNAGLALSFDTAGGGNTLTFDLRVRNNNNTAPVPFTESLVLRSSLDNFATDIAGAVATGTQNTIGASTGFINKSFSLASLGTMLVGTAVTFRLYPFDNQNAAQDDFSVDNLTINGMVPEPSSWAAMILGGASAGLLALRRRRAV